MRRWAAGALVVRGYGRGGLFTPSAKRCYRDDRYVVLRGECFELRAPHNVAPVRRDDLAQKRCPAKARQFAQVDPGLGVSWPLEDATGLCQ